MTRKRAKAAPTAEAPITGVATGSLGTAANLDDTQVLRTEDLNAAEPGWLEDDAPVHPAEEDAIPPDELALLQTAQLATPNSPARTPARPEIAPPDDAAAPAGAAIAEEAASAAVNSEPVVAARPRTRARRPTGAAAAATPVWRRRSAPALAGVAALLVLLLIAGSGFLSQLDLGIGAGPAGAAASAGVLIEAAPSPTAAPKEGKGGHAKCHGRGHNCQGNED